MQSSPGEVGSDTLLCRAGLSYDLQDCWLMGFKSVLLLISNHCSAASRANAHKQGGLCITVGPYSGVIKNASTNGSATSQGSWLLMASFEPHSPRTWNLIEDTKCG